MACAYAIDDVVHEVCAALNVRWRGIDPLLPLLPGRVENGAECLVTTGPDGRPAGFALHRRTWSPDDKLDQTWGTATKFVLRPRIAGPDVRTALADVLAQWRCSVTSQPDARSDDTAATVNWPARDVDGILPLLSHGMQPMAVIAARGGGPIRPNSPAPSDGLVIREAGPDDLAAVTEMEMGVIRYDAQFGTAIIRPATDVLVRADATTALAKSPSWTWLAERRGRPVGLLVIQPPAEAAWIAVMTSGAPAAYLQTLFVPQEERGTGVGARLVSRAHEALDAAGISVTILHYSQVNPLSGPFWNRMGYRPLWTTWEARPAAALR